MSKTIYVNAQGEVLGVIEHGDYSHEPDYKGFYDGLLASNVYHDMLAQPATAELARALAIFVSAIQDCLSGRENRDAMQGAIWLLLSQITLEPVHAVELSDLIERCALDGVYSLSPGGGQA